MTVKQPDLDVLIVGAGFSGLYLIHKLRQIGLSCLALEAGEGIGGTWYWNRYPGARCDVPSFQYSFSFDKDLEQEWEWSERYAPQPEILDYAEHVAERFDLKRSIKLSTKVVSATFEEQNNTWSTTTESGDQYASRFVVFATGCLSVPFAPTINGLENFSGPVYHTGKWPHEQVSFEGLKVGFVGTGSSGIQSLPIVAKEAAEVTVFQRTANYSVPAHNSKANPEVSKQTKANYPELRELAKTTLSGVLTYPNTQSALEVPEEERTTVYEERWADGGLPFLGAYSDIMTDLQANETASEFFKNKIRGIVKDPATAELLCPKFPLGGKRMCVDTDFYQTFNRNNVTLISLKEEPIECLSSNAVHTTNRAIECDALVLATGFDAMTGALNAIETKGKDGQTLKDQWASGPQTYLGLMVNGFPNLFTVTGPGSPSVFTNMLMAIEQHVDWITDCLEQMKTKGQTLIEAKQATQDEWGQEVQRAGNQFLRSETDSWYNGANIEGKAQVFMPYMAGLPAYRAICDEVASENYRGFSIT